MNQQLTIKQLTKTIEQLEQEYSTLTQEYKSCEVMIESRIRQKDICQRQVIISRELRLLREEIRRIKEKQINSL